MNDTLTHGAALWLAQATLLLGCFWAAYGLLRSHPRARVVLCRIVSVALLALPLLTLAPVPPLVHLPAPRLPATMIDLPVAALIATPVVEPGRSTGGVLPVGEKVRADHPIPSSHLPVLSMAEALLLVWLLGSAFLVVRWLMALRIAQRLVRSGQEPPGWAGEIQAEIASHLQLTGQIGLGVIDGAGSPLLLGPRPVILLPRHLVEEDAQDDFVPSLAHEMVHVKEFDWWWSQWLQLVAAMLWPVVPVWFLRRAHDSAAEIVCDSIAASLVGGTELYAGTLARQSLHAMSHLQLATVPMLRRSGIRQRIDLLLSGLALPAFSRRAMMISGLLALLACGALSGVRVAAAGEAPTAPTAPTPAVAVAPVAVAPAPVAAPAKPVPPEIEPYGGIAWNDGVFEVIQKIKKIEGITSITWLGNRRNSMGGTGNAIDLTTITTPEELSAAFEKMLSEYFPLGANPKNPLFVNPGRPQQFDTYKDASGNDKKVFYRTDLIGNELSAGPIILAGHPFTLVVSFGAFPGFAVQFPDQAINLPNYGGAVVPLAITTVTLTTETNLSDEARKTIADKLIAKYGITDINQVNDLKLGNNLTILNRGPAHLIVSLNNSRSITYDYNDREDLIAYYQNLLTKLAEQAAKKGPDGTNGL